MSGIKESTANSAASTASNISVIIPAHNEAAVIARCLEGITRGARPGELEVLVVCNGCTDDTAEISRSFGDPVQVIETDVASKSHALNLGDRSATGFPRFFIDADIAISLDAIRAVAEVLRGDEVHGAAPQMEIDLSDRSWSIRAFYDVWMRLPYVNENMLGCGVYAISEQGRARFEEFPPIIADDCFIRLLFAPHERRAVEGVRFRMTPPKTLHSLIHINVRRLAGESEMAEIYGEVPRREHRKQRLELLKLFLRPQLWPSLLVYCYAKAASVGLYRWKEKRGRHKEWARDQTSRDATP
jgi:glycosyltransferase involved in cell wall biosynthesis